MQYKGTGVSAGIAIGKAFYYDPRVIVPENIKLDSAAVEVAVKDYFAAKETVKRCLDGICKRLAGTAEEKIFVAHADILDDETLDEAVLEKIREQLCSVDYAVYEAFSEISDFFSHSKQQRIRERASDVEDLRNRVLHALLGSVTQDLSALSEPVIVFARDLMPSDTATMDRSNVLAIVTEEGGETSHTAILAKSFGIPAIVNTKLDCDGGFLWKNAIVDGSNGTVILDYSAHEEQIYLEKKAEEQHQALERSKFLKMAGSTKDGVRVDIGLNVGTPEAAEVPEAAYTDFVGLFRTEFLYMTASELPTEEEQLRAYSRILKTYSDRFVTLRTLDIGGDKTIKCFQMPYESNPFLGCRALRLCFKGPEMFHTQLRAALRASTNGKLWIMFPMVGSLDDFRRAKKVVESVQKELEDEGIAYSREIKYGVMIEVPSIAIMAEEIAKEADFASIGTNDLCQYLLAADRGNPAMGEYYQTFHPAMFRLIGYVIKAFNAAGKPLSVCGEMGGNPMAAAILVGMGMRKLSMSPACIAPIKKMLASYTIEQLQQVSEKAVRLSTQQEVLELMEQFLEN